MDVLKAILEQQPMIALFLTIAIGYLLGEINIKGFSLGAGAVLFVALAIGWFAPKSVPAPMVGTLGLAFFLYAVGIQYGKQFFIGLKSPYGRKANFMALVGVVLAGAVSLLFMKTRGIAPGYSLGLFAGAGTSTPTLQAALVSLGNDDAAVGYSVAYPIGVAGPILFLYIFFLILKPKISPTIGTNLEMLEVVLRSPGFIGKKISELMGDLPEDVQVAARRREGHNEPASPDSILQANDVLLLVSPRKELLEQAQKMLGETQPGQLTRDRQDMDYLRVFASRPAVVGHTLGDLHLPTAKVSMVQVRRGDTDILPHPDLVLEFGDRIGLLASRVDFTALRKFFGDSIKGTAEFSYISIGVGMALGFLVGALKIPLPGMDSISLGLAGVLIVALILGNLRRTGGICWALPLSANIVLRNLGLTLFLAQVGMSSGPKFVATVAQTGFMMLALGLVVLIALVLPVIILGLFVFRMSYEEVSGIVAGACGNPAILAYANKLVPTEKPDLGYAMIFPGMTIIKILFVVIVPAFL